jgi:hypothetical protein
MSATRRAEESPDPEDADRPDRPWSGFRRFVEGFFPTEAGEPPVVLRAGRARLVGVVATLLGLLVGAATGFLVVLFLFAAPEVPGVVAGFAVGALLGAAAALVLASRHPLVRKGGAVAILLFPVLVVLSPFLLVAAALALLRRGR